MLRKIKIQRLRYFRRNRRRASPSSKKLFDMQAAGSAFALLICYGAYYQTTVSR